MNPLWIPQATGGPVNAVCAQGTTLYIGGSFTAINGSTRHNAAAINRYSGALLAWDPEPDGTVNAITATANGIFIGGAFKGVSPTVTGSYSYSPGLVELDPTYGADEFYGAYLKNSSSGVTATVNSLLLAFGNIYVGGSFASVSTGVQSASYAEAASFSLTQSAGSPTINPWNPSPCLDGQASTLLVMSLSSLGTIYLGGSFHALGCGTSPYTRQCLAEVDSVYGLPTSWAPWVGGDPHTVDEVNTILVEGNAVYAGGSFNSTGQGTFIRQNLLAVQPGSYEFYAWNPFTDGVVNVLDYSEGVIPVGGAFFHLAGYAREGLGAVMPSDLTFGTPNATPTITPTFTVSPTLTITPSATPTPTPTFTP